MKTTWDFVEQYYLNYHGDALIEYSNVLTCYTEADGDYDIETVQEALAYFDDNDTTTKDEIISGKVLWKAQKALQYIDGLIFKKAIETFIKQT